MDNFDVAGANALHGAIPTRDYEVVVGNRAEYAIYVHVKQGYYVLHNDAFEWWMNRGLEQAAKRGPLTEGRIKWWLRHSAKEYVQGLKSYTSRMKPPTPKRKTMRPIHPGEWADETFLMKHSFFIRLDGVPVL